MARSNDILQMTPAELAIHKAIIEVEKMPADVALTAVVIALGRTQTALADWIDAHSYGSPKK